MAISSAEGRSTGVVTPQARSSTAPPALDDQGADDPDVGRSSRFVGGPLDGEVARLPRPTAMASAHLLLSRVADAWHAYQLVQSNADQPFELSHLGEVEALPALRLD